LEWDIGILLVFVFAGGHQGDPARSILPGSMLGNSPSLAKQADLFRQVAIPHCDDNKHCKRLAGNATAIVHTPHAFAPTAHYPRRRRELRLNLREDDNATPH
jgi:hypothetical protein